MCSRCEPRMGAPRGTTAGEGTHPPPRHGAHLRPFLWPALLALAVMSTETESASRRSEDGGPEVSVYQLCCRSSAKEKQTSARWAKELSGKQEVRIPEDAITLRIEKLLNETMPGLGWEIPGVSSQTRPLPVPTRPATGKADILAERVLGHALGVITSKPRFVQQAFHQTVRMQQMALDRFLFPDYMKTHRSSVHLETVYLATEMVNGLLHLVLRPSTMKSKMPLTLIPPSERDGFQDPRRRFSRGWRAATRSFIRRQADALRGGAGWDSTQQVGAIYHKGNGYQEYIGFLHEWRKARTVRSGVLHRGVEHEELRARPLRPGGRRRRYRHWRRAAASTQTLTILRRTWTWCAAAMDLRPNGNDKMQRKPRGKWKKRRRPPPWLLGSSRNRGKAGRAESRQERRLRAAKAKAGEQVRRDPLDTDVAKEERRRIHKHHAEEKRLKQEESTRWAEPFGKAYDRVLRNRTSHTGEEGPIDVYANKRLFVLMLAKAQSKVDWERAKLKFGTEWVTVKVASMVHKLQKTGRCRAAWQQVESQMRREGIPTRKQLEVHVSATVPKSLAYKELRREVAGHQLPPELQQWVSSNVKVVHDQPPTFIDRRHGAALVRDAKMQEVWESMEEVSEKVFHGVGFERIEGSARIPEPTSAASQVESVRSAVHGLRTKLWKTFEHLEDPNSSKISRQPHGNNNNNNNNDDKKGKDNKKSTKPNPVSAPHTRKEPSPILRSYRPNDAAYNRLVEAIPHPSDAAKQKWASFAARFEDDVKTPSDQKGSQRAKGKGKTYNNKGGSRAGKSSNKKRPEDVFCAEDKSSKETWRVGRKEYVMRTVLSAITAGWEMVSDMTVSAAEYATRAEYMDRLPLRSRRFIPQVANWTGSFVAGLHTTIKKKCFGNPPGAAFLGTDDPSISVKKPPSDTVMPPAHVQAESIRSCWDEGHSCTRKIVTFISTFGRRQNKLYHRGAETAMRSLPSSEIWSMAEGPDLLRNRYNQLLYLPEYEYECVACGGPKGCVTVSVRDAPQAYEQMEVPIASQDMAWMMGAASSQTGHATVTLNRENLNSSFLGGLPSDYLDFTKSYVVLHLIEINQYTDAVLRPVLIRVGDSIWKVKGVTIGNPMGKVALSAVTGRRELVRSGVWEKVHLGEPGATLGTEKWDKVARRFKRSQVLARSKYVDDEDAKSLMVCQPCADEDGDQTYAQMFKYDHQPSLIGGGPSFKHADSGLRTKYLDVNQSFVRKKPGTRPTLILRPEHKNGKALLGHSDAWSVTSAAPWWAPYSVLLLAGIFQGFVVRYRAILRSEARRVDALGLVTLEYIFRGYPQQKVRAAWAQTSWSPERAELLTRLSYLWRKKISFEGTDVFEVLGQLQTPSELLLLSFSRLERVLERKPTPGTPPLQA